MKNFTTQAEMLKDIAMIEAAIEKRLEEERVLYDLDSYDINEIRLETYKANGWNKDPYPEETGSKDDWKYDFYGCEIEHRPFGMTINDFHCMEAGMRREDFV